MTPTDFDFLFISFKFRSLFAGGYRPTSETTPLRTSCGTSLYSKSSFSPANISLILFYVCTYASMPAHRHRHSRADSDLCLLSKPHAFLIPRKPPKSHTNVFAYTFAYFLILVKNSQLKLLSPRLLNFEYAHRWLSKNQSFEFVFMKGLFRMPTIICSSCFLQTAPSLRLTYCRSYNCDFHIFLAPPMSRSVFGLHGPQVQAWVIALNPDSDPGDPQALPVSFFSCLVRPNQ